MKKMVFCLAGLLVGGMGAAQEIQWNYNGQATALGSGCKKDPANSGQDDTAVVSAGNETSVIFSKLGVALTGNGGARADKKTCRVAIPTKVRAGYYVGKLSQTMTYGYERNNQTEGKIEVNTQFYEQAAGSIVRNIPTPGMNPYSEPFAQAKVESLWQVRPNWCLQRDYVGNFKANLSVNGYRSSTASDIVIQIDGHDIRFDAVGTAFKCP